MRLLLTCLTIFSCLLAGAQRTCSSSEYTAARIAADPAAASGINAARAFLGQRSTLRLQHSVTYRVPVVVHILYANAAQDVSDDAVRSQIDALNRDFRRMNADSVNTPQYFRSLAADAAIEFVLASVTPEGYPTSGIVRKYTGVNQWQQDDAMKFASAGGDNAWDSHSYLNIWVCPMGRILGYSSAPGGAADRDGIVINYSAFGTLGAAAPFDKGRTAVHEAGHWLGLKHIWGDTYCGDDEVVDTPKQSNYTSGCPSAIRTSCGNSATGDMYMNYMDYTNDACINLFTEGQAARMRANFAPGGPRASLMVSKGLGKSWATPPAAARATEAPSGAVSVYPNPAQSVLHIDFGNNTWTGKELRVYNTQGAMVQRVQIGSRLQPLNTNGLSAGVYWVVATNGEEVIRKSFVKQ
ncbi:T9SS type A sorting domain-containing protein [Flaviaesturariibacter flavus]|uniref:T9SS type A sorting domain-containing protein n=1 Tax=Flaviaesturariibacter flavus TaxID=2502780 RepID=A0A4R1BPT2_9BACT|nr:T9SS type A sorting domain-containing protein [Flaviaesturariibacter flavus]TCJ19650.1 T9SS type A sorting domain-containing protein [Flaviaesturariibacter flavus]